MPATVLLTAIVGAVSLGGTASLASAPAAPLVPGHPRTMTIAVYARAKIGAPVRHQRTLSVRSRGQVASVVQAVNALHPVSPKLAFSCGLGSGGYEILTFFYAHAPPVRINVWDRCPPTVWSHGRVAGADRAYQRLVRLIDRLLDRKG
jgi:hypothetical protein